MKWNYLAILLLNEAEKDMKNYEIEVDNADLW